LPAAGLVTVSNTGGGTLQYSATAATDQGTWLTLLGGGAGSGTPSAPAALGFIADPTGLTSGLYKGQIKVQTTDLGAEAVVDVTLAVGQGGQLLTLSQSGLTFSTVAGSQPPPSQSFTVSSQTSGSLSWTVQQQTIVNPLPSSANWLSFITTSGFSIGGQTVTPVEVSVNSVGLPAGQYYGFLNILEPNAVNSPQSVLVVLNVTAAGGTTNIGFSTGGIILSGPAGSSTAQQQQISLFNPSNGPINYSSAVLTSSGVGWLSVSPASGQLLPGNGSISIAANLSALSPGSQTGTVSIAFDNGTVGVIQVAVIATSPTPGLGVRSSRQ
jgi:hypothetical protein